MVTPAEQSGPKLDPEPTAAVLPTRAVPSDPPSLSSADIVPDAALGSNGADQFEHTAIAGRVADLAANAQLPVNIALFGPWGAGKSSFFELLRREVAERNAKIKVVRYDAWKYGGASLRKNFISSTARSLNLRDEEFDRGLYDNHKIVKLDWRSFLKNNWKSLLALAGAAVVMCAVWVAILATVAWINGGTDWIVAFKSSFPGTLKTLGTVLVAVFAGLKILDVAKITIDQTAPSADEEFGARFVELVKKATKGGKFRLLVFVDELDRCSSSDVVETLVSLKTFLDQDSCIFVVAADRDVLEDALSKDLPHPNPVRDTDPYYSTAGAFLDKVFQHQLSLPPLRQHTLTVYARSLVVNRGGLWGELASVRPGGRLLDDVVYTLIPSHVRSPRRVKVLLNNYATNVRIAQARGIAWPDRAVEVAKLTVLQTEFPPVAADLLIEPRLPGLLLEYAETSPASGTYTEQQARLLKKYSATKQMTDSDSVDEEQSAGGVILHDDEENKRQQAARLRAQQRLNEQLHRYLERAKAADIPDPLPDLLYLQAAGAAEGILDPDLNAAIDLAADVSPSTTLSAFDASDSRDVQAAMRMLASRSDGQFGPGRANLVSVVCQLSERLTSDQLSSVSPVVAPSVLSIARSGLVRSEMLPGAINLASSSSNDALVGDLIELVTVSPGVEYLPRVIPSIPAMSEESAKKMFAKLGELYFEDASFLHRAITVLPAADALKLWNTQLAKIENAFEALNKAVKAVDSSTPPTSSATKASVAVQATETTAERGESLFDALDERSETSPELLRATLELALYLGYSDLYEVGRRRARSIIERIDDDKLIASVIEHAICCGPAGDWSFWLAFLPEDGSGICGDISDVVLQVFDQIPNATEESLEVAPEIVRKFVFSGEIPDRFRPKVVTSLEAAFGSTRADSGTGLAVERRTTLHLCAGIIAQLIEIDGLSAAVAEDLINETVSDELSVANAGAIILRLGHSPVESASKLDEHLNEVDTAELDTRLLVVRIHIAARSASGSSVPISADEMETLAGVDGASAVIAQWLDTHPVVEEVLRVFEGVAVPPANSLSSYAVTINDRERSTLWVKLSALGVGDEKLRVVAANGVESEVVDRLRGLASEASRHEERSAIVSQLLTLPIKNSTSLGKSVCEFAAMLLGKDTSSDAALAAKVMIVADGASFGYAVKLRDLFDAALTKNGKVFSASTGERLRDLRLLSKPRKKGLTKIISDLVGIGDE